MKIYVTSVFVDDQAKALDACTRVLGFEVKHDIPLGAHRWLTVVDKDDSNGTELLLESSGHLAVGSFRQALLRESIPAASFKVEDLDAEHQRLRGLGVRFAQIPAEAGSVRMAVLDEACGNLIQLVQMPDAA